MGGGSNEDGESLTPKTPKKKWETLYSELSDVDQEKMRMGHIIARGVGGANTGHSIDNTVQQTIIPALPERKYRIRKGLIRTFGIAAITAGLIGVNTYLHNNYLKIQDSGWVRNNIESSKETTNTILLYGGATAALLTAGYALKKRK